MSAKASPILGTNLSPALLGVGYIVGLNIGIVVVMGGIISWNIGIPLYSAFFLDGNADLAAAASELDAENAAGLLWSTQIRYLGVGAMLIGGIWALISLRKSLRVRHQERPCGHALGHPDDDRAHRAATCR